MGMLSLCELSVEDIAQRTTSNLWLLNISRNYVQHDASVVISSDYLFFFVPFIVLHQQRRHYSLHRSLGNASSKSFLSLCTSENHQATAPALLRNLPNSKSSSVDGGRLGLGLTFGAAMMNRGGETL